MKTVSVSVMDMLTVRISISVIEKPDWHKYLKLFPALVSSPSWHWGKLSASLSLGDWLDWAFGDADDGAGDVPLLCAPEDEAGEVALEEPPLLPDEAGEVALDDAPLLPEDAGLVALDDAPLLPLLPDEAGLVALED
jgi:hypothetical protein